MVELIGIEPTTCRDDRSPDWSQHTLFPKHYSASQSLEVSFPHNSFRASFKLLTVHKSPRAFASCSLVLAAVMLSYSIIDLLAVTSVRAA